MSQSTTEPADGVIRTSDTQAFCCKSIDKLIAGSEHPETRLSKTLGPWSLTALGIGAIIGSGIFVLTGTAAAGEYFQAPSILHAQALDLLVNFLRTGSTAGALHLGLRDGDRYVDPEPLIGELRGTLRLVPSDGGRPAPAPAPQLACPVQFASADG